MVLYVISHIPSGAHRSVLEEQNMGIHRSSRSYIGEGPGHHLYMLASDKRFVPLERAIDDKIEDIIQKCEWTA